jgi:hypothetical protein
MGVEKCHGCKECNTTLEMHPSLHKEPALHQFVTMYDQYTGQPYERCLNCNRTKAELEGEK